MEEGLNLVSNIGGADGPTSIFLAGSVGQITMVVTIVVGLLLCFFGLKIMKALVTLVGFAVGAAIGIEINIAASLTGITSILVVFGVAILVAALAFFVYRLGIFITAFGMISGIALAMIDSSVTLQLVIALVITLILAILCMVFMEPAVVIITALCGGIMAGESILSLAGFSNNHWIGLGVGIVLAIIGAAVQFMMQSRKIGKKEKQHAKKVKEKDSMESEVEKARMLLDDEDDEDEDYDNSDDSVDSDDSDDLDDIEIIEENLDDE